MSNLEIVIIPIGNGNTALVNLILNGNSNIFIVLYSLSVVSDSLAPLFWIHIICMVCVHIYMSVLHFEQDSRYHDLCLSRFSVWFLHDNRKNY